MRIEIFVKPIAVAVFALGAVSKMGAQEAESKKEVAEARERQAEAQAECRLEEMAKMRTADYVIIFPAGIQGSGEDINKNCRPGPRPREEDVQIRIYGDDTAVVTGLQTWMDGPNKRRFTSVWIKSDGAWRHASFQATIVREPPAGK